MTEFHDPDAVEVMLEMVREKINTLRREPFPTPAQSEALESWRRVRRHLVWELLRLEMFREPDPPAPSTE